MYMLKNLNDSYQLFVNVFLLKLRIEMRATKLFI